MMLSERSLGSWDLFQLLWCLGIEPEVPKTTKNGRGLDLDMNLICWRGGHWERWANESRIVETRPIVVGKCLGKGDKVEWGAWNDTEVGWRYWSQNQETGRQSLLEESHFIYLFWLSGLQNLILVYWAMSEPVSPAVEAQSPNQSVFPSPQGNTKRPILDSENELPVSGSTTRLKLRKEDGFWQASLVAQVVKNLPAMQETQVWSLGREDSLGKKKHLTPEKSHG